MKAKCKHDWTKWGEPYEVPGHYMDCSGNYNKYIYTKQRRECSKCGLQEEQQIAIRDDR
jgi:hypothetical protein